MAAPLVAAAIIQAKAGIVKDMSKGIRSIGQKILSDILGCRIKPSGTKHEVIYQKAPKYFSAFGVGVPESPSFKKNPAGEYRIFDPVTGFVFVTQQELETILPLQSRKEIEATLRKKCETLTGSFAYYIDIRNPSSYRGFVRLADGAIYDAATYSLQGDSYNSPKEYRDVQAKVLPGQNTVTENGETKPNAPALAGMGGLVPLLLLGGLAFAGKVK